MAMFQNMSSLRGLLWDVYPPFAGLEIGYVGVHWGMVATPNHPSFTLVYIYQKKPCLRSNQMLKNITKKKKTMAGLKLNTAQRSGQNNFLAVGFNLPLASVASP